MVKAKYTPATFQPKSTTIANVMDITNFLAKYLSGRQNVVVAPLRASSSFSVGPRMTAGGKEYWQMNVPHWDDYDLPLKGFDKYRIYREGVWHEACHIKFSPRELFVAPVARDMISHLVNIIEDRRIEDLGVKEWQGYIPERLYMQAYAYALRPSVDKIQATDHRLFEAFLQRLLIGKYKGTLSQQEADVVEQTVKRVEEELKKIEGEEESYKIEKTVKSLAFYVRNMLNLSNIPPLQNWVQSHWEETFTEGYARSSHVKPQDVEKQMGEFFDDIEKKAKDEEREEGKTEPMEITKEDVEQARKGSVAAHHEYEQIQKKQPVTPELFGWNPVASQATPSEYRDAKFIQAMNTYLKSWREGFVKIVGSRGTGFSVKEYIRHKDKPFITKLKQSVQGKKLFILADFSGSMAFREEDYKKALISSLEVLNSIGCNVALFAFAEEPAQGNGFYRIKTFEESKLTNTHLAKVAALEAGYPSTPTANAYKALREYINKTHPEVMVTITDGSPDEAVETERMVKQLKRWTRMVAFGIAQSPSEHARKRMEQDLKWFGYHKVFAVNYLHEIPPKLVNLLLE